MGLALISGSLTKVIYFLSGNLEIELEDETVFSRDYSPTAWYVPDSPPAKVIFSFETS